METAIQGVYLIDLELQQGDRSSLATTFSTREFKCLGLQDNYLQCNLSFNYKQGTLRGMHYQISPVTETKLIRCTQGAIFGAIVDLNLESPTYLKHISVELTAENHRALYVPEMFAHGYQTLIDNTEVVYQVSEFYTPDCEQGLRHNDPKLNINWPLPVTNISDKDAAWPLLDNFNLSVGSLT